MRKLKAALLNQLRKRLYDFGNRANAGTTQTFNGDGTTKKFTLNSTPLLYVSGVSVSSASQRLITDYNVDFGTTASGAIVEFITAPVVGTGNVSVEFVTGTQWIYDDQPRVDSTMPRCSVLNIGGSGETPMGAGDAWVQIEPTFRVGFWVKADKRYLKDGYYYGGSKLLDYLNTDLQDTIKAIRQSNDLGNVVDIKVSEPVYLGLDEDYDIKRTEANVRIKYLKNYP